MALDDGPPITVFDYQARRAGAHARAFLHGWRGHLMVDDYVGYKSHCRRQRHGQGHRPCPQALDGTAALCQFWQSANRQQPERTARMPKVKQKISGGFRTVEGADNCCVIDACLDTPRKQGHGMLEVLQRAFAGNSIEPAA